MDRTPPLHRRSFSHFDPQPRSALAREGVGAAGGPLPTAPLRQGADPSRADRSRADLAHAAVPSPAPPCHARARQRLYRAMDHLTFRGALIPLVSSLMKLGISAISGGGALRHTLLAAAGSSAAQALVGSASSGDREHGFTWVSTLAPRRGLTPPPSVLQWGMWASQEDQRRLATIDHWRATIDRDPGAAAAALPPQGRAGLEQLAARMHTVLSTEKNQADALAGVLAMVVVVLDGVVAAQAKHDADVGRLAAGSYWVILVQMGLSILLDAAACHWQMQMRSPSPASYPRPHVPAQAADAIAPRLDPGAVAAGAARPHEPRGIQHAGGEAVAPARASDAEEMEDVDDGPDESGDSSDSSDSDMESGCRIMPLQVRDWGPAGGPAAPPARPGGGPGPAADRPPPYLR